MDGLGQGSGLSCCELLLLLFVDQLVFAEALEGTFADIDERDFADDLLFDIVVNRIPDLHHVLVRLRRAAAHARTLTGALWSMPKTKLLPSRALTPRE